MNEKEHTITRKEIEALFVKLEKPLFNLVYRWLWNVEDAHDVVQEAFVRLWKKREGIKLETIEAYAYRIALNLASNRRRSKKIWQFVSLNALFEKQTKEEAQTEEKKIMCEIIEKLPDKLKKVVLLCDLNELSYEEVGQVLGVPAGTVGSRRNKALKMMREAFEKYAI